MYPPVRDEKRYSLVGVDVDTEIKKQHHTSSVGTNLVI
jgi:hypothetical protein